jgi:hypothetical protein
VNGAIHARYEEMNWIKFKHAYKTPRSAAIGAIHVATARMPAFHVVVGEIRSVEAKALAARIIGRTAPQTAPEFKQYQIISSPQTLQT